MSEPSPNSSLSSEHSYVFSRSSFSGSSSISGGSPQVKPPEKLESLSRAPSASLSHTSSSSTLSSESLGLKEVNKTKVFGACILMIIGGLPKTILNLPVLKQLSCLSSCIGGAIGGGVGEAFGRAEVGTKIGLALFDPRSIFNGIYKAGDKLLKDAGVSTETRAAIHNITEVNLTKASRRESRMKFVERECKNLLIKAAEESGVSSDEASKLATQWMIAVKSDLKFVPQRKTPGPKTSDRPAVVQYKEWQRENKRLKDIENREYLVACCRGKNKLDLILNVLDPDDPIILEFNELMQEVGQVVQEVGGLVVLDVEEEHELDEELAYYQKINKYLDIAFNADLST